MKPETTKPVTRARLEGYRAVKSRKKSFVVGEQVPSYHISPTELPWRIAAKLQPDDDEWPQETVSIIVFDPKTEHCWALAHNVNSHVARYIVNSHNNNIGFDK